MSLDIIVEVGGVHRLMVVLGYEEVAGLDGNHGVEFVAAAYFLAVAFEITNHIIAHLPVVECVVTDGLGGETRHEFLVLKRFERELVARLGIIVVAAHVGYLSFSHLHLDIGAVFHAFVFDIGVGILYTFHIGWRNNVG